MQPFLTNIVSTTVVMYWTAFLYHFLLASEISMLGTSIPLVMELAKTHGMNPLQLGLIWTFAAGGKLFAYQSGVLIVGYSYGYFDARDLVKMGAWLTRGGIRDPDAAGAVLLAADRAAMRVPPAWKQCEFLPRNESSRMEACQSQFVCCGFHQFARSRPANGVPHGNMNLSSSIQLAVMMRRTKSSARRN